MTFTEILILIAYLSIGAIGYSVFAWYTDPDYRTEPDASHITGLMVCGAMWPALLFLGAIFLILVFITNMIHDILSSVLSHKGGESCDGGISAESLPILLEH